MASGGGEVASEGGHATVAVAPVVVAAADDDNNESSSASDSRVVIPSAQQQQHEKQPPTLRSDDFRGDQHDMSFHHETFVSDNLVKRMAELLETPIEGEEGGNNNNNNTVMIGADIMPYFHQNHSNSDGRSSPKADHYDDYGRNTSKERLPIFTSPQSRASRQQQQVEREGRNNVHSASRLRSSLSCRTSHSSLPRTQLETQLGTISKNNNVDTVQQTKYCPTPILPPNAAAAAAAAAAAVMMPSLLQTAYEKISRPLSPPSPAVAASSSSSDGTKRSRNDNKGNDDDDDDDGNGIIIVNDKNKTKRQRRLQNAYDNHNTLTATTSSGNANDMQHQRRKHQQRKGGNKIDVTNNTNKIQMLLLGPNQSGKTSLAMDMAYSMALVSSLSSRRLPCRGCFGMTGMDNAKHDKSGTKACRCVRVAYLVHKRRKYNFFPLKCRKITVAREKEAAAAMMDSCEEGYQRTDCLDDDKERQFRMKMKEIEKEEKKIQHLMSSFRGNERNMNDNHHDDDKEKENSNNKSETEQASGGEWDEDTLSRIHVKYLQNMTELVEYLLSIQGMSDHLIPLNGIIIDNIDDFVRDNNNHDNMYCNGKIPNGMHDRRFDYDGTHEDNNDDRTMKDAVISAMTTLEILKLIQLLALFANTGECLQQLVSNRKTVDPTPGIGGDDCDDDNDNNKDRCDANHCLCLLATMNDKSCPLPPHAISMLSNWMPTIASIRPLSSLFSHQKRQPATNDEERIMSKWEVGLKHSDWSDDPYSKSFAKGEGAAVSYGVVVKDGEHDSSRPEIIWN